MRVLMLSLDRGATDEDSLVGRRIAPLSRAAGEIVVLTPSGGGRAREFFRIWRDAKAALREKKFDLITVQDSSYLALLAYLLARRFRIPFEVQVHGFEKMSGIRERLARFVLARADKIRVVSERLKRELSSIFHIPDSKFYVLPVYTQRGEMGEMGERGDRGRKGEGVPYPFLFLTVSRLVPVKNVGMQIRAFAKLVKEFPQARLRIVGDGPERDRLKIQVERLKLGERISFEGRQEHLERCYKDADAFLFTSDAEGWGLVVTEAAAYGLPIIMTDVGLAGEFIKNDENGIVIPVGDEDTLVSATSKLITDAELRARLGENARRAFLALPSKEKQIQKQIIYWDAVLH